MATGFSCLICSSTDEFEPQAVMNFRRCARCGSWTQHPHADKEKLRAENRYFMLSATTKRAARTLRFEHANRQLDFMRCQPLSFSLPNKESTPLIYDVGAAAGFFLSSARARGFEVHGNELSESAIVWALHEYGIGIDYGFLEDITINDTQQFHRVCFTNVLEHLPHPVFAMSKAYSMLKPDGMVYILVPTKTKQQLRRRYERAHTVEFSDVGLEQMMDDCSMTPVDRRTFDEDGITYQESTWKKDHS